MNFKPLPFFEYKKSIIPNININRLIKKFILKKEMN